MRSFFFSRDMYGVALARTLHLLFAFLQRPLTWVSKFSLLSILTPNNSSQVLTETHILEFLLVHRCQQSYDIYLYFLSFDYDRIIETIFLLILVKIRLLHECGKQSKAFERLINSAPNTFPLSTEFFHFSNIASKQCWALKPSLNPHWYLDSNGSIKIVICLYCIL